MAAAASQPALPNIEETPAAFIVGLDEAKRPHGAWFVKQEIERATSAAELMSMQLIEVGKDTKVAAVAAKLPRGKLFGSGKAFVPFLAASTFEELLAFQPLAKSPPMLKLVASVEEDRRANDPELPPVRDEKEELPKSWSAIKVGSTVLASETREDGWWEAIVTEVKATDLFVLKWADWPDLPPFARHRERLALRFAK
jgi:hypothetical protein